MKTYVRIVLLISVLAIFAWIGLLSSAQKRSTGAAVPPEQTGTEMPLFLNGKPAGSVANLQLLKTNLAAIYRRRPSNSQDIANSAYGSVAVTDRVIFVPDGKMTVKQFGTVAGTVQNSLGYEGNRVLVLDRGGRCSGTPKNDPANIYISTTALVSDEGCWIEMRVAESSARLTKRYRISMTGLEINADGSCVVNQKLDELPPLASPNSNYSVSSNRMIDSLQIKQRPIDPSSLEKEVAAGVEQRIAEKKKEWEKFDAETIKELGPSAVGDHGLVELPVIVNEKAYYSSVEPILRLIQSNKVKLTIVIDNSAP